MPATQPSVPGYDYPIEPRQAPEGSPLRNAHERILKTSDLVTERQAEIRPAQEALEQKKALLAAARWPSADPLEIAKLEVEVRLIEKYLAEKEPTIAAMRKVPDQAQRALDEVRGEYLTAVNNYNAPIDHRSTEEAWKKKEEARQRIGYFLTPEGKG